MAKVFKASDKYSVKDLLQYAYGHLLCAEHIFKENNHVFLDSGGVLGHIGIELVLKAWLLHLAGEHKDIHKLRNLYDELIKNGARAFLNDNDLSTLDEIDGLFSLRYPPSSVPIEVGSDDWDKIDKLMTVIDDNMPQEMKTIRDRLHDEKDGTFRKGGRVLMMKPE